MEVDKDSYRKRNSFCIVIPCRESPSCFSVPLLDNAVPLSGTRRKTDLRLNRDDGQNRIKKEKAFPDRWSYNNQARQIKAYFQYLSDNQINSFFYLCQPFPSRFLADIFLPMSARDRIIGRPFPSLRWNWCRCFIWSTSWTLSRRSKSNCPEATMLSIMMSRQLYENTRDCGSRKNQTNQIDQQNGSRFAERSIIQIIDWLIYGKYLCKLI